MASAAAAGEAPGGADSGAGGADVSDLRGLPRGGSLGPGRFLFRGQLFWQQLLEEHVATNQLEFRIGLGDDPRNFARIPSSSSHHAGAALEPLADEDPFLIQAAVCVAQGREDESEVMAAVRAAASWGDRKKLRVLLASCFVPARACGPALCEAVARGHEDVVRELLRARVSPAATDGAGAAAAGKTPLHIACEQGHEPVARLLLEGRADMGSTDTAGRTACELAREVDLGMMAKRLERDFAAEAAKAAKAAAA